MKILRNGDKFYNYIKKKVITVNISACPKCNNEAVLVDITSDQFSESPNGGGHAFCANPNCTCCTMVFFTDTNTKLAFGIELAQEKWNNRCFDFFDNDYEYEWIDSLSIKNEIEKFIKAKED